MGMTQTDPLDPCRCPLCGASNGCAMANAGPNTSQSTQPCWCTQEQFSAQLLQQVPATAKNRACICQACVQSSRNA